MCSISRIPQNRGQVAIIGALVVSVAVALSGCGGSSSNRPTPNSPAAVVHQVNSHPGAARTSALLAGSVAGVQPAGHAARTAVRVNGSSSVSRAASAPKARISSVAVVTSSTATASLRPTATAVLASLRTLAACMREHGVSMPEPVVSGGAPKLNMAGVNIQSSAYETALTQSCLSPLRALVRAADGDSQ